MCWRADADDIRAVIQTFGRALSAANGDSIDAAIPRPLSGTERVTLGQTELRTESQSHSGSLVDSDAASERAGVPAGVAALVGANSTSNALADPQPLGGAFQHPNGCAIGSRGLDDAAAVVRPQRAAIDQPDCPALTLADGSTDQAAELAGNARPDACTVARR